MYVVFHLFVTSGGAEIVLVEWPTVAVQALMPMTCTFDSTGRCLVLLLYLFLVISLARS
jgi:hypothetical protein